ncbi:MAG: hypothetical protein ACAF41_00180 (plasmid) [Leptolyngbya sp. BL-A-14]
MTNKERLLNVTRFLPLDKRQASITARGISRLSEEEAKEIADELEDNLSKLPGILGELKSALLEAALPEQAELETVLMPIPNNKTSSQSLDEEVTTGPIVAAIFRNKSRVANAKQQLLKRDNVFESDIYIVSVENQNTISLPDDFQPVEVDGDWFRFWLLIGLGSGFVLDFPYFISDSFNGYVALLILAIASLSSGTLYIIRVLRESETLKENVISLYRNRLQVNESLMIVKTSSEKSILIQDLLKELGGEETKIISVRATKHAVIA